MNIGTAWKEHWSNNQSSSGEDAVDASISHHLDFNTFARREYVNCQPCEGALRHDAQSARLASTSKTLWRTSNNRANLNKRLISTVACPLHLRTWPSFHCVFESPIRSRCNRVSRTNKQETNSTPTGERNSPCHCCNASQRTVYHFAQVTFPHEKVRVRGFKTIKDYCMDCATCVSSDAGALIRDLPANEELLSLPKVS